jgi:hypothetical protein
LTRQRKHLVHSDPGSDRCIAQAGLANRFLHASGANSATLERMPTMLFFRALISAASRRSTARTVSRVTWHSLQIWFAETPSLSRRTICL